MTRRSGALALLALFAALSTSRAARAEAPKPPPASVEAPESPEGRARGANPDAPQKHAESTPQTPSIFDRPHTILEIELGLLTLPTAPISPAQSGGNIPIAQKIFTGDTAAELGLHLLYRATRDFVVGAGASFGPNPNTDSQYVSGNGSTTRTHSRSYLFMGGEARYYALRAKWFEGYVGLVGGVILVGDRFQTAGVAVPAILGTRNVTVRTEGFSFGVEAGGNYIFNDNLVFGLSLRANRWLLPEGNDTSQCDAIGDCPTLTGSVAAFEIGLTLGYRIPL